MLESEQMASRQKSSVYSKMIPFLLKKALPQIKVKKKKISLIDLGCGSGDILFCLYKEGYLRGVRVLGVDIDQKATKAFKKKVPGATVIIDDVTSLTTLKKNSFDFVICNQVIEHVKDDKILVSQIRRILKENGLVYITSVLKKWYGLYWYRNKLGRIAMHPDHIREYSSPKEFKNLLAQQGFEVKNLVIYSSSFPLSDYFLLFLAKIRILRFSNLRDFYLAHPKIYKLASKILFPPIPGYATIEAIAKKR